MAKYTARLTLDVDIEAPEGFFLDEILGHIDGFNTTINLQGLPVQINVAAGSALYEVEEQEE